MKHKLIFLIWLFPIVVTAQTLSEHATDSLPPKHRVINFKKAAPILIPAGMFAYGLLANENKGLQNVNLHIRDQALKNSVQTNIDDHLQTFPVAAVYALNIVGVKSKHKFIDRTLIYALSNLITSKSVDFLKTKTHRLRPDGGDFRSFPSGHTATAFASAEFMREEFENSSKWYGIGAYSMAATTGSLRILKNKHWFSDVIAGAGVGILSTKAAYFIYPKLKSLIIRDKNSQKEQRITILPTYHDNTVSVAVSYFPN